MIGSEAAKNFFISAVLFTGELRGGRARTGQVVELLPVGRSGQRYGWHGARVSSHDADPNRLPGRYNATGLTFPYQTGQDCVP